MPQLLCALGILVGSAAIHSPAISEQARRAATILEEARGGIERAVQAAQVSNVDLLMVAIAEEAIEEIEFAAPDRWRTSEGRTSLSEAELKAIRSRLEQVATAGHATALGQFEIVLRPGESLGLSTHRHVKIAQTTASGDINVREASVDLLPTLRLNRLDLFGQQLTVSVDFSVRNRMNTETFATSSFRLKELHVRAGESLMVIAKNPLPIDQRATEQQGAETRSLDHQHRLLIMTPGRERWPKSNKQIARERELPQLAK